MNPRKANKEKLTPEELNMMRTILNKVDMYTELELKANVFLEEIVLHESRYLLYHTRVNGKIVEISEARYIVELYKALITNKEYLVDLAYAVKR